MTRVREILRRSRALRAVWRLFKDAYFEPITKRIAAALPKWRRQTVVQIGANDGLRDDPIAALLQSRCRWRALLVEPLPEYFKRLVENHGHSRRFMFEQAAVGAKDGQFPFYHLSEQARASPHWRDYFDRIGSLTRADLIHNLGDDADAMAAYIEETMISVLSLTTLLSKWRIRRIDALIIDAEGHDWIILKQVFELGLQPRVLMFEHTHLSASDRDAAEAILRADYGMDWLERDCLCIRRASGLRG